MKAVVQRCKEASVIVEGKTVGEINKGILVLVGVKENDTKEAAELLARKISTLRIFSDAEDKMNLSVIDVGGSVLAVSNFTLCADTKKGTRPSYSHAMRPDAAKELYDYFCDELKKYNLSVEKGVFGAEMQIDMQGDGPVTIILDTDIWL
jgi:D-tyrosyl-tRNA(Tyr) deacylase